jgi:TolB protein
MMPDVKAKHLLLFACSAFLTAFPAPAQDVLPVIAVPSLPTPRNVNTDAGETGVIGIQAAELIASDLRSSGDFMVIDRQRLKRYSPTEAGAPIYPNWTGTGAGVLVTGYVQARDDGRITLACYLYDLKQRRELARKGFVVLPDEWRRAAHRCADAFYRRITGAKAGHFDTSIAYVAETGARMAASKRLALMNWDGTGHRYLTDGQATVLSPRFSPDRERIAFVSFTGGRPHVRLLDIASGQDRPLLDTPALSFAPTFSPDGRRILFSMANEGNTDIYVMDVDGGFPRRLTAAPGIDTAASFSPDGTRIVFESDRSGAPQLYVMDSDGSGQRRISFGGGAYSAPRWSQAGDRIAFSVSRNGRAAIGVMAVNGADEKLLTRGWQDEAPSWAPSGRALVFQRSQQASGIAQLYSVALAGGEARPMATPQPAADPAWSGASE